MTTGRRGPAWVRLVAHSHRLGARWLARGVRGGGFPDLRGGLYRLLVPLEPWRYYEVARLVREPISGDCLDVSSPKLLPSLLRHEGSGNWVAIDVLPDEIARWRGLDPDLDLRVADARALPFADGSFDTIACVSVIEHVVGDGDATAMAEMWRVLRPGGVMHLTTNVAPRGGEVRTPRAVYEAPAAAATSGATTSDATSGDISTTDAISDATVTTTDATSGDISTADAISDATATDATATDVTAAAAEGVFFERRYDDTTLDARLLGMPWSVEAREYVCERMPVHRGFFGARPLLFIAGNLLPLVCPLNFRRIGGAAEVPAGTHGVVYLRLRRPS